MAAYSLPAALCYVLRVRFLTLTHPERIGHLCIEPDCYIKEGLLGLRQKFLGVFLVPEGRAANKALLSLWSEKTAIVTSRLWCRALLPFTRFPFLSYPIHRYAIAIDDTALCATIQTKWKGRPALLSIPPEMHDRAREAVEKLGLPAGAWYVCVHSREGGYSPSDEHLHAYRNSDIDSYRLAMREIVERGGWCVRVGDPTSKPISPMKGVIDCAHSALRCDWLDVYLCANCMFFLGNSSGLHLLSSVFGIPCALANLIPVASSLPAFPIDVGIPKILRRRASGEAVRYAEIMASPLGNFRFAEQYAKDGIFVEQNTPEEIRDLAIEMLERCSGKAKYAREDEELQGRFRSLFRQGHYSFGADSRIGRDFLRTRADII